MGMAERSEVQARRAPPIVRALSGDLRGVMRYKLTPNYLGDSSDTAPLDCALTWQRRPAPTPVAGVA
jgi:hypothetical protein